MACAELKSAFQCVSRPSGGRSEQECSNICGAASIGYAVSEFGGH